MLQTRMRPPQSINKRKATPREKVIRIFPRSLRLRATAGPTPPARPGSPRSPAHRNHQRRSEKEHTLAHVSRDRPLHAFQKPLHNQPGGPRRVPPDDLHSPMRPTIETWSTASTELLRGGLDRCSSRSRNSRTFLRIRTPPPRGCLSRNTQGPSDLLPRRTRPPSCSHVTPNRTLERHQL